MNSRIRQWAVVAMTVASSFYIQVCNADALKSRVEGLSVVPVQYGINALKLMSQDILIIRGRFETGTAWGGDIYTVLVRQPGNGVWRMARHEKTSDQSGVLTITTPHTGEDSIRTVRFMVPSEEIAAGRVSHLYVVQASRAYDPNIAHTAVTFTFAALERNADLDIFYFHELAKTQSQTPYCNAEMALHRELGLPLPEDGVDYDLCNRPQPR